MKENKVADPILGVGAKLISLGLGRGVSLLFSKAIRVRRIDQALKGQEADPKARLAMSDYETYLASIHGGFSVDVEAFHNELVRSGLVDAMTELSIVGRHSEVTLDRFKEAHRNFFPDSSDVEREALYDKLATAFRVTMSSLTSDPAMLKFMQSFHKQINARLDQIESIALDENSTSASSPEQLFAGIQAIAKGLQNHYKTLKVETLNGARQVNISDIYVAPALRLIETARKISGVVEVLPPLNMKLASRSQFSGRQFISSRAQLTTFSYPELRKSFRRLVVLGDPGGGKSTICQRLCFDMARSTSLALQYQGKNHVALEEQKVPFRIVLRLFEQARLSDPQLDILTYLKRDLKHHVNSSDLEISAAVDYLLSNGRAIIAFDGLDEILETSNRREYVDLVVAFCNKFALCPALITSRLVGYENAPLPGDFDRVVLQKFSDEEVMDYSRRFLIHVGDLEEGVAEVESRRFAIQTLENAADLRRNPLMLGLMLWLFRSKGDVPSNRPAIYSECATLMFDKWDSNRGIKSKIPTGFDRSQLFSSIAAEVYEDPKLRAGVSRQWLHDHLVKYFKDKFIEPSKAYEVADSLVSFLVGRAWVMMEAGDGIFAFTHQTFLEYFYAKHIEAQHDSVGSLFRAIRGRIAKKERDVVTHLALQLKCFGNDRIQLEAINEIIGYVDRLSNPGSIKSVVAFSAKALEYLVPSEPAVRKIIKLVVDHSIDGDPKGVDDFASIGIAINSCNLRRSFVLDEVARQIVGAITSESETHAQNAMHYAVITAKAWIGDKNSVPSSIAPTILAEVRENVLERAEANRWWASKAFSAYAFVNSDLVRRFGVQTYYDSELISAFEALSGLDGLVLGTTTNYKARFIHPLTSEEDLKAALAVMGQVGFELAEEGPIPIKLPRYQPLSIPVDVWRESLAELVNSPPQFVGAVFAFVIEMEEAYDQWQHETRNPISRIKSVMKDFEKRNPDMVALMPALKPALNLRRGAIVASGH